MDNFEKTLITVGIVLSCAVIVAVVSVLVALVVLIVSHI